MITKLTLEEKQNIIKTNMDELMRNHLCGNYFDFTDINCGCTEWIICNDTFRMIAFTEYGTYSQDYDFDYSFDSNLQAFYEELREFMFKNQLDDFINKLGAE